MHNKSLKYLSIVQIYSDDETVLEAASREVMEETRRELKE